MNVCVVCYIVKDKRQSQDNQDEEVQVKYREQKKFPLVSLGIFSVATDGTMCPGVDIATKNE
jgi:hypothetical protein